MRSSRVPQATESNARLARTGAPPTALIPIAVEALAEVLPEVLPGAPVEADGGAAAGVVPSDSTPESPNGIATRATPAAAARPPTTKARRLLVRRISPRR